MYHRKRSLRSGSGCASVCSTACSACSACSTGSACFNSSAIMLSFRGSTSLLPAHPVQKPIHARGENRVSHQKKQSKDAHRDDHHRGGGLHFLPRRRNHLAHLRSEEHTS